MARLSMGAEWGGDSGEVHALKVLYHGLMLGIGQHDFGSLGGLESHLDAHAHLVLLTGDELGTLRQPVKCDDVQRCSLKCKSILNGLLVFLLLLLLLLLTIVLILCITSY